MKVVILAGGFGTRISEESVVKPKPMIEIGYKPILWHIMKLYSHFDFNDFIICLGYKGYMIKEYFDHYFLHEANVTYDFSNGNHKPVIHAHTVEPWKVTLVNTGLNTMTGGRIKRIRQFIGDEPFLLTYGDGLSDVDIRNLLGYHRKNGKTVTVTAIQASGRFGIIDIDASGQAKNFWEKPKTEASWINGGFFVVEPSIFDYIDNDETIFEKTPLAKIAEEGNLQAYKHRGFWQCMDRMSDKVLLESMWEKGTAPWKLWKDT